MKTKQTARPQLKSATALSPLEMNGIHFDKKHTILTPEVLDAASKNATSNTADNH